MKAMVPQRRASSLVGVKAMVPQRRASIAKAHRMKVARAVLADGQQSKVPPRLAEIPDNGDDVLHVASMRGELADNARPSPFCIDNNGGVGFVDDNDRVRIHALEYASSESAGSSCQEGIFVNDESCIPIPPYAVRSGPRKTIYYDPTTVRAAIVTCGGLCPGLNDVVRQLVLSLGDYGVSIDARKQGGASHDPTDSTVLGIYYGFAGFYDADTPPDHLTREDVDGIQLRGGTMLGTSRGGSDMPRIVEQIERMHINMLFVVGGNGGHAGANAIHAELQQKGITCSVIGVPKSIDNDILVIDKCFGFDTAVEQAVSAIYSAKVEASSARNGVGVVKLMGRQSGFIAMAASMASGEVDLCLIPEIPFEMDGAMHHIERIVRKRGHAVVVVAEGAGQDILDGHHETDASGNPVLKDVGPYLRDAIKAHFKEIGDRADVKYIDPSYIIRAAPTIPSDKIYCQILAQGAVHAAFAGVTAATVGLVNGHYVWLPIETVIQAPRVVDPRGRMWGRLLAQTKQPAWGTLESANPVGTVDYN